MKIFKLLLTILLVSCFVTSCDDALDINTNPLAASSADPNAVLPFVLVQYSNRHTTELGTRMMDVPQYYSFCYNSPRAGNTSSFLTGNTWAMYYTDVLGNLALVEADAAAAGESSNNISAIAKILKAKSFFELSSIWEKVPFSQALNGEEFPSPIFDEQQSIMAGCVSILDEAMTLIDNMPEGVFDVSVGDVIYGGNMDNWRRWANSLKIRILMMMRNKDTSVDAALTAALGQPVIESNDQTALLKYFDTPGSVNAHQNIITTFFGGTNESATLHTPGIPVYNLLNDKSDPRFDFMIFDPNGGGVPDIGENVVLSGNSNAAYSNNVIRNTLPHIMFTPAEIDFYKAELALLGVTSDDAQAHFEAGLTKILSFWGGDIPDAVGSIDPAVIADYVANYGTATLQDVHEQLYLEGMFRPVVGWNTVRRTGVPTMEPVPGTSIATILKRFDYPPDEAAANGNTPANQPTDTPMWFEN